MVNFFEALEILSDGIEAKFTDKVSTRFATAEAPLEELHRLMGGRPANGWGEVCNGLISAIDQATDKINAGLGEITDKGMTMVKGANKEAYDAAVKELRTAQGNLNEFLKSDQVPVELKTAFESASGVITKVADQAKGFVGKLQTQGFKHSFETTVDQVKKSFTPSSGQSFGERSGGFVRVAGVSAAVVGVGDAILRSKNANGEDRSVVARVVQAVVSGFVGFASVFAGRAVPAVAAR